VALLEVKNLVKHFSVKGPLFSPKLLVRAVDGVSFTVDSGRTFGLVGESGCGKSTLGRLVLRLIEPTSGNVLFNAEDITALPKEALKQRRRDLQMIFQDPYASLNPRMTILETLLEPMEIHGIGNEEERLKRVEELLELVGLRRTVLNRYPHEFSGGQRQRVGIARALTVNPKFIVADEPVSALDVSVQSQVLNLITELQSKLGLAFLFISHDLAVVQHVSHDVGVMYLGKLVEKASSESIYKDPKHPYTKALLGAIPARDPAEKKERMILGGDVPSAMNLPSGCPFHTRCPVAEPRCSKEVPKTVNVGKSGGEHLVSCHLYGEEHGNA